MTIETDYPDYRTLVEKEAPLGFARHFALCEMLGSGYAINAARDALISPQWPPMPAFFLGDFSRADNHFSWSDRPPAQGLRELGQEKEGFALLASESFDADVLSPFELGAACSALSSPATTFLAIVTPAGFQLFLIGEAPLDLRRLSLSSTLACLREASRYCRASKEEWVIGLLDQLGFSCQPGEQGVQARRGDEHFQWSFAEGRLELVYGRCRTGLLPTLPATVLADLIEQGSSHLDQHQDFAAARQALLQAVALDPQSYEAQLQLGRVELSEGRLEQAELRLLLASLLRPRDGYALSVLGDCYALADKIPQAMAVQERLLALDPGNEAARESLERLRGAL